MYPSRILKSSVDIFPNLVDPAGPLSPGNLIWWGLFDLEWPDIKVLIINVSMDQWAGNLTPELTPLHVSDMKIYALLSSVKIKFTTCVKWTFISCMLLELTLCESLFQQSYKFSTENFCLRINFSKVNWTLNLLLNALGLSFSAAPDEYNNMNGRDLFLPGLSPCPRISSRQIRDLHVMTPALPLIGHNTTSMASDWLTRVRATNDQAEFCQLGTQM